MTEEDVKIRLQKILRNLGVETAGRRDDVSRWSGSDLGTDMAPLVLEMIQAIEGEQDKAARVIANLNKDLDSAAATMAELIEENRSLKESVQRLRGYQLDLLKRLNRIEE